MRVTHNIRIMLLLENCKFDIAGQLGYYNFQKQLHFATGNKRAKQVRIKTCLMSYKMAAACLFTSFQIITDFTMSMPSHNIHQYAVCLFKLLAPY